MADFSQHFSSKFILGLSAVDRCNFEAINLVSHIFYSVKSYDKNITGLAVGILAMGHTRQCAYTSTRAEALVLV